MRRIIAIVRRRRTTQTLGVRTTRRLLRQTAEATVRLRHRARAIARQNRLTPDRRDPASLPRMASVRLLRLRAVRCLGANRPEARSGLAAEATGTVRRQVPRCSHVATQVATPAVTVADPRVRSSICTSRSFALRLTVGTAVHPATVVGAACQVTAEAATLPAVEAGTSVEVQVVAIRAVEAEEVILAAVVDTPVAVIASLKSCCE